MTLQPILNHCMDLSWVAPGLARRISLAVSSVLSAIIRADVAACEAVDETVHVLAEVELALLTHCPIEAETRRDAERMEREVAKRAAARSFEVN